MSRPSGRAHRERLALEAVEELLRGMEPALRDQAEPIPVQTLPRPTAAMRREGIEPDTLGLFVGGDHACSEDDPLPSEILLFTENLWDFAEGDEVAYLDEVRRTYLHELGHYLGLNEDDLTGRELD
jgi:predicted Zn-dependent protease with MMP-like domain